MPASATSAVPSAARHDRIDALRALAMLWMAGFHLAFDLNHFGLIAPQNFYHDPLWTRQRIAIVSLFLFTAGLGQAIAITRQQPMPRFWRRWAQIAGCAVLVSIGSWFMFPQSWISFGVLHGIALMLVLVRATQRWPLWALLPLAVAMLVLPWLWQHPVFDARWSNWVGLVTHKPRTEDYVPVLPWAGVMLLGVVCGRWLLARDGSLLSGPLPAAGRQLARLGRWPLTFYMLHQPVLIAGVMAWRALRG